MLLMPCSGGQLRKTFSAAAAEPAVEASVTGLQCPVLQHTHVMHCVAGPALLLQRPDSCCLLQTQPGPLQAGLSSPQASIRSRAARVLKLLGLEGADPPSARPAAAATAAAAAPAAAAPVPDLLGGLDADEPLAPTAESMLGGPLLSLAAAGPRLSAPGDLLDPVSTLRHSSALQLCSQQIGLCSWPFCPRTYQRWCCTRGLAGPHASTCAELCAPASSASGSQCDSTRPLCRRRQFTSSRHPVQPGDLPATRRPVLRRLRTAAAAAAAAAAAGRPRTAARGPGRSAGWLACQAWAGSGSRPASRPLRCGPMRAGSSSLHIACPAGLHRAGTHKAWCNTVCQCASSSGSPACVLACSAD